jgi:hypothetical protein
MLCSVFAIVFSISSVTFEVHAATVRPQPLTPGDGSFAVAQLPLALRNDSVNVVVQLAGDPVSVRQAKANRKLSNTEKDQIKAQLKSAQSQLHARISRLGGSS